MRHFLTLLILFLSPSSILSSHGHGHNVPKHVPVHRRDLGGMAAMAAAEAPAPAASSATTPAVDLIGVMSKNGCKTFADLLNGGAGDVAKTFEGAIGGGLTVFCPKDDAMKAFLPKFKNLTADDKVSFLLYHGVPVYNSLDILKTNNGVVNTLATDARNYNFTVQNDGTAVTLQTDVTTATITTTVLDRYPLAVYAIDAVLEPRELFEPPAPVPAPESAVAPAAEAPEGGTKKKKHAASPPMPEGPNASPADQKAADESGAGRWAASMVTAAVAAVVVVVA